MPISIWMLLLYSLTTPVTCTFLLTNFVGKKVQVTGAVGEYNNNLQIEIRSLDQLKLVP